MAPVAGPARNRVCDVHIASRDEAANAPRGHHRGLVHAGDRRGARRRGGHRHGGDGLPRVPDLPRRWRPPGAARGVARAPAFVGRIEMGLDEGVTGWVARPSAPAFIRDSALHDPRMRYFRELEEEPWQSMAAVPVTARSGEVIGVIVLHTAAPHEFGEEVLTLLTHTASLVGGAIENAQLYEEARTRVASLTSLAAVSQRLAAATRHERLHEAATAGARALLGADLCQLFRLEGGGRGCASSRPTRRARRRRGRRAEPCCSSCSPAAATAAPAATCGPITRARSCSRRRSSPPTSSSGCCACWPAALRAGRRGAAARARRPDRDGPRARGADRPADRARPRQGPVRRARRRLGRPCCPRSGARRLRPLAPACVPPRRVGAERERHRRRLGGGRLAAGGTAARARPARVLRRGPRVPAGGGADAGRRRRRARRRGLRRGRRRRARRARRECAGPRHRREPAGAARGHARRPDRAHAATRRRGDGL